MYFAGGEPLLIKEHKKFLLEIIEKGHAPSIHLRYNTNGTLVDEEMIDIWSKFKIVKVNFSLDGLTDKNHYIRFPTDWADIERSLQLLDNAPDTIHTNFAFAVQILNIKHLPDFIKWKLTSNFKKINQQVNASGHMQGGGLVGTHLLWIPTWLSIRVLPKEDKEEVHKLFDELKQWLWNNYSQDKEFWEVNPWGWQRLQGILDWMDVEDNSHLIPDLKEYIKNIDAVRGLDASSVFPELAHLWR